MKKTLSILLSLVMLVAVFAGCSSGTTATPAPTEAPAAPTEAPAVSEDPAAQTSETPTLDRIKQAGELVVLTSPDFPPYEYLGDNNEPVGIDMDIAQIIADELGVTLSVQPMDFSSIIGALMSNKGDVGAAGFTVTEERKESVDFSIEYATTHQYAIVAEGSEIKSSADLAGKSIGVQEGTTGDFYATDEIENSDVQRYPSAMTAAVALKNGQIDAVIVDELPARSIVASNSGLVVIEEVLTTENYAFAIAKGQEDLVQFVNDVLDKLIKDGTVQQYTDTHVQEGLLAE